MNYRIVSQQDHVIVKLSGDVMGGPDYEFFHNRIRDLVDSGYRRFVIDMSTARWINSTGLGILVSIFRTIHDVDGSMVICGANKRIRGIYFVSQLDKVFATYSSLDEGVAAVTAA